MERWRVGLIALVVAGLLVVQLADDALFGPLGGVPSFARAISAPWPFALARATGADRNPAVRIELARAALVRNDPERAAALVTGLPPGVEVADLRGRIAADAGRAPEAVAAFGAAGDVVRVQAVIDAVAVRDPVAAFDLAAGFARDTVRRNEPAAVQGAAAWRAGDLAVAAGRVRPADAARDEQTALDLYRAAVRDDPTQEAYWLAVGMTELNLGRAAASHDAYARAVQVVPDSVDAYVGRAASDARLGDCSAARADIASAQAFAARQGRTAGVATNGYDVPTRRAFDACMNAPQ